MQRFSPRIVFFLMSGLGIGGFIVAQALELYGPFPGCRLCHLERWILLTGGWFSFLAWVWWPFHFARFMGYFTFLAWIIGSGTGLYHAGIQYGWIPLPSFCKVQDADSLDQFLSMPTITCNQRTLDFFSVPAALYLGISLLLFGWICFRVLRQRPV